MVVRNEKDQQIYVFTKGADEAIFPLLCETSAKSTEAHKMMDHVDEFAREGLRTLVFAIR